jgi:protein-L-isoaspartate(D-aspartate) O-methyltransferase
MLPVPSSYIDSIAIDSPSLSTSIRDALKAVRRHRFLDGWFHVDIIDRKLDYRYVTFDRNQPSEEALSIIYSNQALVTAHDEVFPTSSTSQPSLVARMLQLLELDSGMRILEIGTGTGYNAALLAELSGEPSHIFTIECQQEVAERAIKHLREEGYGSIHVVQGDGFQGIADGAPFDRIIATVGCSDISPHWLKQLSPDGMMLIPLNHGFSDPLARFTRDPKAPTRAVGEIVERSAFMRIQGLLEWGNPWRSFSIRGLAAEPLWVRPLPDHLEMSNPFHHPDAENNHWCFRFFLALCSRELWNDNRGYGLADPGNNSVVLITPDGLKAYPATGNPDACERLYERLMAIHQRWTNLGWPAPADFQLTLIPKMQIDASFADPMREWTIERPYFLETIRLP